jgi:hypothetical protein
VQNYNQVKGRNMIAYFRRSQMARIDVLGNAESLYFTLDGDTVLSGMNKSVSATMTLRFVDNKIKQLSWLTNPEASYTPVHELQPENKQLKAFRWRPTERPTRRQVFGKHFASDLKHAKPKPKAKAKLKTKIKAKARPKAKSSAPPTKPAIPNAAPRPPVTVVPAPQPATVATPR